MLTFLWTYRTTPGARLQMWGLQEDCTHFAVKFGHVVFHQVWSGFDIDWYTALEGTYHVRYALAPASRNAAQDMALINRIVKEYHGTDYDKLAWCYFAIRAAAKKFGDVPLPKVNAWEKKDDALCTGIGKTIYHHNPRWFSDKVKDYDIVSPGQLYANMVGSQQFINVSADFRKG